MLKPYVCVACEKVIVEQVVIPGQPAGSGPASLINLFSKMIVETISGSDIPPNAVAPKEWTVFSMWDTEPEDANRAYFLCTQMFYPDGSKFGSQNRTPLAVISGQRSQMIVRIMGFPVGQAGFYKVQTWIEEGQAVVYKPIEFNIELQVIVREQPQAQIPTR